MSLRSSLDVNLGLHVSGSRRFYFGGKVTNKNGSLAYLRKIFVPLRS